MSRYVLNGKRPVGVSLQFYLASIVLDARKTVHILLFPGIPLSLGENGTPVSRVKIRCRPQEQRTTLVLFRKGRAV